MIRTAIFSLILTAPLTLAAEANPALLKPTQEQLREAEKLVGQLGSEVFRERDAATRKLTEMGRIALPAVVKALAETANAEVRERCEALRPRMEQQDVQARLDAFLADTEGKYDHKLPGWTKFHKIVGNTAASRKLYGEMYADAPTAHLLALIGGDQAALSRAVLERRAEVYKRMYGQQRFIAGNGIVVQDRHPPEPAEVAGLLFTDGLLGSHGGTRRSSYNVNSLVLQAPIRELLNDEVKGAAHRKLVEFWCDSRDEGYHVYLAMSLASTLNLKELKPSKYALKVLDSKALTPLYYGYALSALAKAGKEELPNIVKQFKNTTPIPTSFFPAANGASQRVQIEVRDMALAMAIVVTEQKPEDFGFQVTGRGITDSNKFLYNSYRLETDEKRDAAFKKWEKLNKK